MIVIPCAIHNAYFYSVTQLLIDNKKREKHKNHLTLSNLIRASRLNLHSHAIQHKMPLSLQTAFHSTQQTNSNAFIYNYTLEPFIIALSFIYNTHTILFRCNASPLLQKAFG